MNVPNHSHVPQKLYATGLFDLKTHDGQGAFVDAVLSALHGVDEAWCHLRKKSGQTSIHGHAEDAALYLFDDGTAIAVDFIGGAGGSNPQPGWIVGEHVYKHSDGLSPTTHGTGGTSPTPQPPPQTFPYPDENTYWKAFQDSMTRIYKEAGRTFPDPNDPDAFRRFSRCGYDCRGMDAMKAAEKHLKELRAELGLPV